MFPGYCAFGDSRLQWGVAGWSGSVARAAWLCTAEVFDTSIEMLCRSNSESTTMFVFLPAQVPGMCSVEYEAVQLGHSVLDGTILCIL